jgi:hypothetical protein
MKTMFPQLVTGPAAPNLDNPFSAELMLDIHFFENLDPNETRMMERLAVLYLVESKQLLEKVGRAIERGIFKEATLLLDSLVSSTAMCNIQCIGPALRELARAVREGNHAAMSVLYESCAEQLERIRQFLRSYISG